MPEICPICRHKSLYWTNDFTAEEVGYSEEGLVRFLTCGNCKAEIEAFIPTEQEDKDADT